jgi:hypothetical protein
VYVLDQGKNILAGHTVLGRISRDIDLQQQIDTGVSVPGNLRNTPHQFFAIDRMYPAEITRDESALVGLQVANKMPVQCRFPELRKFAEGFLHLVLAKISYPQIRQRLYVLHRFSLGYGDKTNRLR